MRLMNVDEVNSSALTTPQNYKIPIYIYGRETVGRQMDMFIVLTGTPTAIESLAALLFSELSAERGSYLLCSMLQKNYSYYACMCVCVCVSVYSSDKVALAFPVCTKPLSYPCKWQFKWHVNDSFVNLMGKLCFTCSR